MDHLAAIRLLEEQPDVFDSIYYLRASEAQSENEAEPKRRKESHRDRWRREAGNA